MPKRSKAVSAEGAKASAKTFPIIGIGASAGGLAALETFFTALAGSSELNAAFVVVQHLAPDHKSILAELIGRYTSLKVFEVKDGMEVEANCIYVIPPKHNMALINGLLELFEPVENQKISLPVDFFFHSLAVDKREQAVAIILSGAGSDGTQGIRSIKAEGGMVMAQASRSAEFSGMPVSAIATGLVDYELSPAEMPAKLREYLKETLPVYSGVKALSLSEDENSLHKIFILLRSQTGHDFSLYKSNTISRRIERRMLLNHIDSLALYVKYLQENPAEVEALFHELLIGVTSFFRDKEAFETLQKTFPRLFENLPEGSTVRVWSTGCSTGEEAYSIAILLYEYIEEIHKNYKVQIFATDIDPRAIARSRAGVYPVGIAADVSAERLSRFFTLNATDGSYHIHKNIREMLIFSEQNIIKDPPFSKIDLISCRNLLIYLDVSLQKKLIPLFHYALNPKGILFLGNSETVGEFDNLFFTIDAKSKIFERKEDVKSIHRGGISSYVSPTTVTHTVDPSRGKRESGLKKQPLKELVERTLLEQVISASILINAQGDILYLQGHSSLYLELPSGEATTNNILKMARKGLTHPLSMALHKATADKTVVRRSGILLEVNGHSTRVNLTISRVEAAAEREAESTLFLVIFEELSSFDMTEDESDSLESAKLAVDTDKHIAALRRELHMQEEFLQTTNEKLAKSNDELRDSNEALQSINEELQSTNEELETSKEELQSVNEELSTVNVELQEKVDELSRSNNDMNNLLAGTGIGTVFVDTKLRILRFTPAATKIINLIVGDIGRPVGHIVSNLCGYNTLTDDTQRVLDSLIPKELEVETSEGRWYIMRIQPYRTLDNVIEGVVITFVDISETVQIRRRLEKVNNELLRLAVVVRDAYDAITVQDLEGRILAWNPAAERIYAWSEAEALNMNVRDRIPENLKEETLAKMELLTNTDAVTLEPYHTQRVTKRGDIVEIWLTLTALVNENGETYAIASTEREIKNES